MSDNQVSTSSLQDLLGLASRHAKKTVVFCLLTWSVAIGIIAYHARSYESVAKLYVRVGREMATLDPSATTGQTVAVRVDQQKEVNSLLDILESRGIAERVVDEVGVETILAGSNDAKSSTFPLAEGVRSVRSSLGELKAFVSDPVSERENAVTRVENMTEVSAPRESTVITIICKAGSPELAQEIASAMTGIFLDEHLRLCRTKGTHLFFDEQSQLLREQLTEASRELAARKNEFQLLSVDGERRIIAEELKSVRLKVLDSERELTASDQKVRHLEETIASVPPEITETVTGFSRDAWTAMRDKLYGVEILVSGLRSKYTDAHPAVGAVADQHQKLSNILESQPEERTQVTTVQNPTRQAVEVELLSERATLASLQAMIETLAEQQAEVVEELELLNEQEWQIARLEREVELLHSSYQTHAEKAEEARIYDALEAQKISSINVVQEANFVGKPVSPNKRFILLAAVAVSMFGGLGLALLSENRNPEPHTTEEKEVALRKTDGRRARLERRVQPAR